MLWTLSVILIVAAEVVQKIHGGELPTIGLFSSIDKGAAKGPIYELPKDKGPGTGIGIVTSKQTGPLPPPSKCDSSDQTCKTLQLLLDEVKRLKDKVLDLSTLSHNQLSVKVNKDSCGDHYFFCPGWASEGFCKSNPGYMYIYCEKSCGRCGGCKDESVRCPGLAAEGQCKGMYKEWMITNCARSCKQCATTHGPVLV